MGAPLHKLDDDMFSSVAGKEPVKDLEQSVDDRLTQGIGAFSDFVVGRVTRGQREITAWSATIARERSIAHCAKSARLSIFIGWGSRSSTIYGFFRDVGL